VADANLSGLTPETSDALSRLTAGAQARGITLHVNSAFRTYQDQQQLYANYQAGRAGQPLPYPDRGAVALAARPGYSPHEFGVAFDVSPNDPSRLGEVNALAPGLGLTTVAGDPGHFQLASWKGGQAAPDVPASQSGGSGAYLAARENAGGASGTTLNSNVIDTLSRNIAGIESGGQQNPYGALNPTTHAIGKYQVMPSNVPGWTLAATGQSMTPDQFRASPQAQEAVFRDQMQRSLQLYSPADAASIWFTGKPSALAGGNVRDANGTTNANYVSRATAGLPNAGTVAGNTLNTTGGPRIGAQTGSPTGGAGAGVGGVASTPGQSSTGQPGGALAGSLPGFTPNSPGAQMTAKGLQSLGQDLGGGGGGDERPPPMPSSVAPPAMASGGTMMLAPGGQNTYGERAAQQDLAQRGYMLQPSLAALQGQGGVRPTVPAAPIGQASGIPGLPGTTLNSPSQLQMALMTGAINPYDLYGSGASYGGAPGYGSA
jgi:hypothetical protein